MLNDTSSRIDRNSGNRIAILDGIRGYAALGIFIIHIGQIFRIWGPYVNSAINYFQYGVISFLIVSVFAVIASIDRTGKFNYPRYLKRRLTRIAKVYFPILIISFLIVISGWKQSGTPKFDFTDLFYHLTFINMFVIKFRASIIGVEWFIPILMLYYVLIPTLYFIGRRSISLIMFISIPLLFIMPFHDIAFVSFGIRSKFNVDIWSPQFYSFYFIYGIICAMVARSVISERQGKKPIPVGLRLVYVSYGLILCWYLSIGMSRNQFTYNVMLFLMWLYLLIPQKIIMKVRNRYRNALDNFMTLAMITIFVRHMVLSGIDYRLITAQWTALFIAIQLVQPAGLTDVIYNNKIIQFVGAISFPFYLAHLPIGYLIGTHASWIGTGYVYVLTVFLITTLVSVFMHNKLESHTARVVTDSVHKKQDGQGNKFR